MKPKDIILIFLAVIFLFFLGQYLYFYPGKLQPFRPPLPHPERPGLEEISLPKTEMKAFTDVYQEQKGRVLLDLAHNNDFQAEELSLLILRITSRGYDFEYLKEKEELEAKLKSADALVVTLPQDEFSKKESGLIKEFGQKGGKVLLIGDPSRPSQINSLAADFGIIFESDYLYNQKENDGNFRYIFIKDFKFDSELTKNLEKIALYSASSISSPDLGIVFTDENTFSSVSEVKGRLSPIVLSSDSRVLAISDLTFMVEPYNANFDNNQFIANLANWITKSERVFHLSDFPYFFKNEIQLTYADATYLDSSLKLKKFLSEIEKSPKLSLYEKTLSPDTIYLGLFDDAVKQIGDLLKKEEISIGWKTVNIEGFGAIDKKGTSIFYLQKTNGQPTLIILSETKENLGKAIEILVDGKFRDWLVSDTLAIYQIKEEEEKEEE